MQVCWEKFANYFEVEIRAVKLREDYYVMDPAKAVEMCDENTICVCAILGSTYNGEFEDVATLNDLLDKKNKENGSVTCFLHPFTATNECRQGQLHVGFTKFKPLLRIKTFLANSPAILTIGMVCGVGGIFPFMWTLQVEVL